jgi:hypothetical protein
MQGQRALYLGIGTRKQTNPILMINRHGKPSGSRIANQTPRYGLKNGERKGLNHCCFIGGLNLKDVVTDDDFMSELASGQDSNFRTPKKQ